MSEPVLIEMTSDELAKLFDEVTYDKSSVPPLDDISRNEGETAWKQFLSTLDENHARLFDSCSGKRKRLLKGIILAVITGRDAWSSIPPGTPLYLKTIDGMLPIIVLALEFSAEHPYLVKPTVVYNQQGEPVLMTTFIPSKPHA